MTSHTKPDGTTVKYSYPSYFKSPSKIEISSGGLNSIQPSSSSNGGLSQAQPPFNAGASASADVPAIGNKVSNGAGDDPLPGSSGGTAGRAQRETYLRIFSYDPTGKLARIRYPDDTFERFEYGCCGLLKSVDRAGGVRKFIYDSSNRKTEEISPNGEKTQWKYDSKNNVVETVHPNGTSTKFEYDESGDKTRITEPDGSCTAFKYDAAGNKIEARFFPPKNGGLSQAQPPSKKADAAASDGAGDNPLPESSGGTAGRAQRETEITCSTYKYDARDRLVAISGDHEKNIVYTYDPSGRPLKIADHGVPPVADARTTENVYDASGRKIKTVHPDGSVETFQYLPGTDKLKGSIHNGIITSYKYDPAGRICAVAKYPQSELERNREGIFDRFLAETRSYDSFGNLLEVRIKADDGEKPFAKGSFSGTSFPKSFVHAESAGAKASADSAIDGGRSSTEPSSGGTAGRAVRGNFRLAARYDYAPDGELLSVLTPTSDSGAVKTSYEYSFDSIGARVVKVYKKEMQF